MEWMCHPAHSNSSIKKEMSFFIDRTSKSVPTTSIKYITLERHNDLRN